MVVDGHLRDVSVTKNCNTITGITGISDLPTIDNGNTVTLNAKNELKGGIQIRKKVYKENDTPEGELIDITSEEETAFKVKVTMNNSDGTEYEVSAKDGGYRIYYGSKNPNANPVYDENHVVVNYGRSARTGITNGEFTAEIYPGDYIQIANVDRGVTYTVEEIDIPSGYEKISITYGKGKDNTEPTGTEPEPMGPNESHQVVVKNKNTNVGFSFSKIWVAEDADLSQITSDDLKDWAFGNEINVVIKRIAQDAQEPDSSFSLTYLIDAGAGPFLPTNTGMTDAEKKKYKLIRSVFEDGKISTFTINKVLAKQNVSEKEYTYFVEEISASGTMLYNKYYGRAGEGVISRIQGAQHANDGEIIINQEFCGAELPHTGGTGTGMYTCIGSVLILLAFGVMMAGRMKLNS